jgi:hypothetical protein
VSCIAKNMRWVGHSFATVVRWNVPSTCTGGVPFPTAATLAVLVKRSANSIRYTITSVAV